jgi:hypothetical protein
MSYAKKFTVEEVIDPVDAARAFANFGSDEQAEFFNILAQEVRTWSAPFAMQMQHLSDDPDLTFEGRIIMETIGNYARKGGN